MNHDLISRKALVKALIEEREKFPAETAERYSFGVKLPNRFNQAMRGGIRKALRLVETAPAIDTVEVVRCEDCKHYSGGTCEQIEYVMDGYYRGTFEEKRPDDFCSSGERKESNV